MTQQTPWDPATGATPPPAPPVPPVPTTDARHYRRRGGIGLGIILIALGLVFLVGQFVPGLAWWQMWPLFVILLGGIQIVTPDPRDGWGVSRVMDGVGTVLVGLVLLGNTTGYVSWGVWLVLLSLWPVLLIAFGLAIVGRALNQTWIRALSPLVIWVALGYATAVAFTGQSPYLSPIQPITINQPSQSFSVSEPAGGVKTAKLAFDGGAGEITIGSTNRDLISATGSSPFGKPGFEVKRSGDSADVSFGLGDNHTTIVGPGFTAGKVDVLLNDNVKWDATLNTGAVDLTADLSNVHLSALTLKTGVSSADVKLGGVDANPFGGTGMTPIVVKAGVSSVTLRIPKGTPVLVKTSSGLSAFDVSPDLVKQSDGSYATPGLGKGNSDAGYNVSIESGVGSVSIRTY
ncbi:MAG: hypothetical protein P4L93_11855 [Coriobacteriia bacterium]|nr:hypothetical protein [Coriobacteriia bacterium]